MEAFAVGTMGKRQLSKKELEEQKKKDDEAAAAHVSFVKKETLLNERNITLLKIIKGF